MRLTKETVSGRGSTRHADRSIKTSVSVPRGPIAAVAAELEELWRDVRPEAEATHAKHDRSHAQAVCQSKKRRAREPEWLRSEVTHLHARRAEGENSGAGQSSRPRAARKGACGTRERHAGRDVQPAAAPTRSQQTQ